MNELALFAGAGGGLLASRLLGWRTVCAVEAEPYRREVLLRRQRDGLLDLFPIWDDVRTFDGRAWRGLVDVVSAGFPCQPFSTASRGRRVAADLWPEALRVIKECQPRFVFAENVKLKPVSAAAESLSDYRCAITRLSAAALGAPHKRPRYWLLAITDDQEQSAVAFDAEVARISEAGARVWSSSPGIVLGMDDGVAHRVDRFASIGDGQVPLVAATAWRILRARL